MYVNGVFILHDGVFILHDLHISPVHAHFLSNFFEDLLTSLYLEFKIDSTEKMTAYLPRASAILLSHSPVASHMLNGIWFMRRYYTDNGKLDRETVEFALRNAKLVGETLEMVSREIFVHLMMSSIMVP